VKKFAERLVAAYAPSGGYIFSATHVMPASAQLESILAAYHYVLVVGNYTPAR
jgi:hypothetical protein